MTSNDPVFYRIIVTLFLAATLTASAGAAEPGPLLGPELIPHGDLEVLSGWDGYGVGSSPGPKLELSTAQKHGGNSSLFVQISRKAGEYPALRSPRFTTQTGRTYRISYWMKVTAGAAGTIRRNGANNDERTLNAPVLHGNQWIHRSADYLERNGGPGAYFAFYASNSIADFYLDDVSVREVITTPASVRAAWRARFPKQDLVVWQKKSPWENLQALQYPAAGVRAASSIPVALGRNEYESVSFAVTNTSDKEMKLAVAKSTGELAATLRHGLWITAHNGAQVNDALALLETPLVIPPGESREVWVTLQSKGVAAGDYVQRITLMPQGGTKKTIDLKARVYPVTLPEDKPIYTCYWDNVVPTWTAKTPGLDKEQMLDLKSHYTNVAVGHPWIVPPLRVDAAGQLVDDYSELDAALENYKTLNPKIILFNWNRDAYFVGDARGNENIGGKLPPYMSEEWKALFRVWLKRWVAHLKTKGYGYDRYAMYPDDETLNPAVAEIAKLIKETDPNVLFYVDSMGQKASEVQAVAPYVDIYTPLLYDYLNTPPWDDGPHKAEANRLLKKRPEFFWNYANPPHHEPQESSGYADYRLALWQTWKAGMKGFGYFIYSYKNHWQNYDQAEWPTWSVVYFANADDAPPGLSKNELVVPGKRWEATREGVEDYVYLAMLKEAVEKPKPGASPQALAEGRKLLAELPSKVIGNPADEAMADRGKEAVLRVLAKLQVSKGAVKRPY